MNKILTHIFLLFKLKSTFFEINPIYRRHKSSNILQLYLSKEIHITGLKIKNISLANQWESFRYKFFICKPITTHSNNNKTIYNCIQGIVVVVSTCKIKVMTCQKLSFPYFTQFTVKLALRYNYIRSGYTNHIYGYIYMSLSM